MSAVQLVVALLLLVLGGALLFRWLQSRHDDEWKDGVKGNQKAGPQRHSKKNNNNNNGDAEDLEFSGDSLDGESGDELDGEGDSNQQHQHNNNNARRGGRGGGLRRRTARRGEVNEEANNNNNNNVHEDDLYDENGVKLTRLQRKKLAKEREREERRQAQEAALEAQRQQHDASTQRDVEAALKEEEMKAAEEKALRQLRAEKQQADEEEYQKWVGQIGVEERGELGDEARERQARVQSYLLARAAAVQASAQKRAVKAAAATAEKDTAPEETKTASESHVLVLQSAARELKVSVEELVTTIEQLTRESKVDGVFDDRGKFVFIAPEHFPQLAQFIRLRGRVSVQEFTRECNRVIMQS